jgi:hypothetical protein
MSDKVSGEHITVPLVLRQLFSRRAPSLSVILHPVVVNLV